jgi:hypothetical protein
MQSKLECSTAPKLPVLPSYFSYSQLSMGLAVWNLITNCSSLRHLAANKCMTASISDKQGKSGRITDRQILNLDKNTHHYQGALVTGVLSCLRKDSGCRSPH